MKKIKSCLKKACTKIAVKRGYCSGHYTVALHKGKFNIEKIKCSINKCEKLSFGESEICWNHKRQKNKEGSKRWKTIKNNPNLYEKVLAQNKVYKKKYRSILKNKRKENAKKRESYWKHRQQRLNSMREYKKSLTRDKIYKQNQKRNAKQHFGSWQNRELVIQRDSEKCVKCSISRKDHFEKWKQDLHVNHIDNFGRNVIKKAQNNSIENLETLCVKCHATETNHKKKLDKRRSEIFLYGLDFTEKLKEQVRERNGRKCYDCEISERRLRKRLDVHHINGDKKNNKLGNLVSLCSQCHYKRHFRHKDKSSILFNG